MRNDTHKTTSPPADHELAIREVQEEHDRMEEAINRGIDAAVQDQNPSQLMRAAIASLVHSYVYEPEEYPGEHPAEPFARHVASEPLMQKVALAVFLEYAVHDGGIEDGILGRHVDQAIAELLPYAQRSHLLGPAGKALFDGEDR